MTYSVQAESTLTPYRVTLTDASGHTWHADEPADKGGQDTAPNPVQLLLSTLGACTTITLEMYAKHKGIKLDHVQVDLSLNPNGQPESGHNNIERKIVLKGEFTDDQHKRLLKVAESCPIHKLLTSNISIQSELAIG
ncbi:OsmC family protein [Acinetobacter suaedae]|uniref:OsmC family protein n=1 Tax=Acinetobacter suaedae TaxID=2609668 RepID=A0A5P1USC0_9GAMM|nr:OsmC family protein [Acinetobacter sp. C16S1]QER39821.1 OsmC family protein [Acinetobacter sp. C16S1]